VVAVVADAPGSVAEVGVVVVEVAALLVVVSLFDGEQASSITAAER
jgi:hypothetical protein